MSMAATEGEWLTFLLRDDDYPSRGSLPPQLQCVVRNRKACGRDHRLGELLHNPEEQDKGRQAGRWERGAVATAR